MKILPEIVFKVRLILLRHIIFSDILQTAIVKSVLIYSKIEILIKVCEAIMDCNEQR